MFLTEPTLSFIVPTYDESRPLKRCIDSIYDQLGQSDELLVVGDTTDGPLPKVEELISEYDQRVRYLSCKGLAHVWGHDQINAGMEVASGEFLSFQDDDDVWTPGCVEVIRAAVQQIPDRIHLFRFLCYFGYPVWQERGRFQLGYVGGHGIICPNIPEKLAKWSIIYNGDWDFIEETVRLNGGPERIVWHEEIIALARPS